MSLYLVDPVAGLILELRVPASLRAAILAQWDRLQDGSAREAFCKRMTTQLCSLVPDALDWDIKAPTPAQLAYALVLSRKFKVDIPDEALLYRSKMHDFIETHASKLSEG